MRRVNVADAKAHLSAYLREVKNGETLVICERNVPVAELRAYHEEARRTPRLGFMKGRMWIAKDAFDPMSEAELAEWERPTLPDDGR